GKVQQHDGRAPSPRLRGPANGRQEGWGEGHFRSAQNRRSAPSPGALRAPTSPRKRGEVGTRGTRVIPIAAGENPAMSVEANNNSRTGRRFQGGPKTGEQGQGATAMIASAHVDTFARDNLPPTAEQPDYLFARPELVYPERLNCAVEFLDRWVAAGHGDGPC